MTQGPGQKASWATGCWMWMLRPPKHSQERHDTTAESSFLGLLKVMFFFFHFPDDFYIFILFQVCLVWIRTKTASHSQKKSSRSEFLVGGTVELVPKTELPEIPWSKAVTPGSSTCDKKLHECLEGFQQSLASL